MCSQRFLSLKLDRQIIELEYIVRDLYGRFCKYKEELEDIGHERQDRQVMAVSRVHITPETM